jgi:hypothetical protein
MILGDKTKIKHINISDSDIKNVPEKTIRKDIITNQVIEPLKEHTSVVNQDKLAVHPPLKAQEPPKKEVEKVKPVKKKKNKVVSVILSVFWFLLITFFVVIGFMYGPPLLSIKNSVDTLQKESDAMKTEISEKNFSKLSTHLTTVRTELRNIREKLDKFDSLGKIGFIKPYYENVIVGKEILDNTDLLISKAQPKIETFVAQLEAVINKREAAENITATENELNANTTEGSSTSTETLSNAEMCAVKLQDNADLKDLGVDAGTLVAEKKSERVEGSTKVRDMIAVLPEGIDIYNGIETELQILIVSINKIDTNALPPFVPQKYIDKINALLTTTKDVETNFPKYSDLIKRLFVGLPDLLGSKKPVTYLLVLQNEKEMRASGGLLTAYGVITIDQGKVVGDITTRDMWDLQQDLWANAGIVHYNIYGQLALMNDGCGASEMRSQDAGIYPDLQVSMDLFTDYYDLMQEYMPEKYVPYDHVIIVNTFLASDMVSLVEPLIMDDCSVVTSENLAKVIFDRRNDNGGRKSNIGRVAKLAEQELTSVSSDEFPKIVDTIIKTVQAKNIAMYSTDPVMEAFFDDLGLTARIEDNFKGDYFHLNEAQVCGLKANFYIKDTVTQNISIADNGTVSKAVKVEWINEKVYDPAEEEIISDSISFPYRAWIRVMAPPLTDFTYTDGYSKSRWLYYPETYYDSEVDKEVSDNVIWFEHRRWSLDEPAPTYELNVAYSLPEIANYSETDGYKMLVQKHPGKADEKYVVGISYKGNTYQVDFTLDRDKVVTFKNGEINVENYAHPLDDYDWMFKSLMGLTGK